MITLESEAVWMPLPREAPLQKKEGGSVPHAALPRQDEPAAVSTGQLPLQWFRDYFDTLWRIALRLGVPRHSVDDVVQDTFITASRRHADIGPGQARRFLIGTVVRVSSNYRQRASVRRELAQTDLIEESEGALPDAEQLLIEKRARHEFG
jgi:DNA-directed RNA polymerase specialized sigma24 family protein